MYIEKAFALVVTVYIVFFVFDLLVSSMGVTALILQSSDGKICSPAIKCLGIGNAFIC